MSEGDQPPTAGSANAEDEMKPCPFCGCPDITLSYEGQPARQFSFECMRCGSRGPVAYSSTPSGGGTANLDTEKHWNLRFSEGPRVAAKSEEPQ
jgi:hypothetical protein